MIVVHKGRIVLEEYPGMREFDNKSWMSNAKTTTSLVIRLLVEEGKIDITKPIETYMPELQDTGWAGTAVSDVLDMASGMDILETQDNRLNPKSIIARFNLSANGAPNSEGKVERQIDVIKSARREKPAGGAFDYSSVNTFMLALLAEAVEKKRWHEIFRERVWSKMTVEGDMLVGLAPDGAAQPEGILITRPTRHGALRPALYAELDAGATRNKSEIAELNKILEKTRFDKVAVSNQVETLKSLASLDSDAVKKALGLPSRTGVIFGWVLSFVLGIATSFSASYLYDLWKP